MVVDGLVRRQLLHPCSRSLYVSSSDAQLAKAHEDRGLARLVSLVHGRPWCLGSRVRSLICPVLPAPKLRCVHELGQHIQCGFGPKEQFLAQSRARLRAACVFALAVPYQHGVRAHLFGTRVSARLLGSCVRMSVLKDAGAVRVVACVPPSTRRPGLEVQEIFYATLGDRRTKKMDNRNP